MTDQSVKTRAEHARRELRRLREAPMRVDPRMPPGDAERLWYERYTPLICDFMCEELADEELLDHTTPFTALHEMMGAACATWSASDAVTDRGAWERFDPGEHLSLCALVTMLPPEVDVLDFIPLFQRFTRYLAGQGVVPESLADAIVDGYDQAAREMRELEAKLEEETVVTPLGSTGARMSIPLPGASAESRRRVEKTDYLVDRLLRSRQGRDLEPAFASMAVHVLVGDHAREHGHRDWERLDVGRVLDTLQQGVMAPGVERLLADGWRAFLDWLEAKGRLSAAAAARLRREIDRALVTLSTEGTRLAG